MARNLRVLPELRAEREKTEESSVHSQISGDCGLYQKCDDEGPNRVCSSLSGTVHEFHPTVPESSHSCSALRDQKTSCDALLTGLCSRFRDRD